MALLCGLVGVGVVCQAVDRWVEDRDRLVDAGELVGIEPPEQSAKLALVELSKTLEEVVRLGRRRDDDMASVAGVFTAFEKIELDETVDELARRRRAEAQSGSELGHAQPAGRADDVEDLRLGHRDVESGELRRVARKEPLHQSFVVLEDRLDGGLDGRFVRCGRNVRSLRTIRSGHTVSQGRRMCTERSWMRCRSSTGRDTAS